MPPPSADPRALLPLTPAVFYVLLALADEDRHGYGIAKDVQSRTDGQVRLGPGTLYGTLTRLTDAGLVAERPTRAELRALLQHDHQTEHFRENRDGRTNGGGTTG